MKLEKDPLGIYSDIPIDEFAWLERYTKEQLRELQKRLIDRDVAVDNNPELEEILETYGPDSERLKIAIENRLKMF